MREIHWSKPFPPIVNAGDPVYQCAWCKRKIARSGVAADSIIEPGIHALSADKKREARFHQRPCFVLALPHLRESVWLSLIEGGSDLRTEVPRNREPLAR